MFVAFSVLYGILTIVMLCLIPKFGVLAVIAAIFSFLQILLFNSFDNMKLSINELEKKCGLYESQIKDLKEKTKTQDKNEDGK